MKLRMGFFCILAGITLVASLSSRLLADGDGDHDFPVVTQISTTPPTFFGLYDSVKWRREPVRRGLRPEGFSGGRAAQLRRHCCLQL
jgi:hypothetical protein